MTARIHSRGRAPRSLQQGLSLIELMIALAIGLIVLGAMVTVFASSSASRQEIERASRQIENGRYAMQLLSDDLRLAGFYGELNVKPYYGTPPATMPDPCSLAQADWVAALTVSLQGFDNGVGAPVTCGGVNRIPGTDVLVIRRVATCEAGVGSCEALVANQPYIQVAKCATETPLTPYVLGLNGGTAFNLHARDCATAAGMRQYYVRIYYLSADNGRGQAVPTLKRMEFNGTAFVDTPLVEGIENVNLEYGIDVDDDGSPDVFTADPAAYGPAAPAPGPFTVPQTWQRVVAVRVNLLARNIEPSINYTDTKTYTLGLDAGGNPVSVTPADSYHRHAYTSLVRVVNVAERKDAP